MSPHPPAAEMALAGPGEGAPDPELEALPEPRRPGPASDARLTFGHRQRSAADGLQLARRGPLRSAAAAHRTSSAIWCAFDGAAVEKNSWVHGEALLSTAGAIRYGRPMESRHVSAGSGLGQRSIVGPGARTRRARGAALRTSDVFRRAPGPGLRGRASLRGSAGSGSERERESHTGARVPARGRRGSEHDALGDRIDGAFHRFCGLQPVRSVSSGASDPGRLNRAFSGV